jgi:hypothetical protein
MLDECCIEQIRCLKTCCEAAYQVARTGDVDYQSVLRAMMVRIRAEALSIIEKLDAA